MNNTPEKPSFLFIVTDQHRADYLGCAGHPVLRTPNIDAIAARGRQFKRFYVANPVCMPNRATLMTGRMPSLHHVRHNGIPLSLDAPTFVDLMRVQGWRTALMGKSHLQTMNDPPPILRRADPPPGYTPTPAEFAEAWRQAPGDYDQESPWRWRAQAPLTLSFPYYGFEHVDLVTEHGDLAGGHYYQWLREALGDPERLRGPENALPHDYVCPQAWRTAMPEEFYPTSWIADRAEAFLERIATDGDDRPFFAMVSFTDPHHPFTPPGHYWDMYRPEDMVLPRNFHPSNARPPHLAWAHAEREAGRANLNAQAAFAVTEREAREAMALTCGMIAMIDDAVGRILAKLEACGLTKRTVVIFTADHGDYLGDHGLLLKGPMHYRGITEVPFIWSDTPDRTVPGTTSALAGTVDIAATILDRAHLQPFNGIQGRSLLPAIAGEADDTPCVVIEDDTQRINLSYTHPPRLRSIITERWRMTICLGVGWGELYDLQNDPDEMVNLFDDPGATRVRAQLFERLAYEQMALVDRSPLPKAPA